MSAQTIDVGPPNPPKLEVVKDEGPKGAWFIVEFPGVAKRIWIPSIVDEVDLLTLIQTSDFGFIAGHSDKGYHFLFNIDQIVTFRKDPSQ